MVIKAIDVALKCFLFVVCPAHHSYEPFTIGKATLLSLPHFPQKLLVTEVAVPNICLEQPIFFPEVATIVVRGYFK